MILTFNHQDFKIQTRFKLPIMKYLRLSFLLFSFAALISSCQKELSYEAGLGKGTLKKASSGECLPVTVYGNYKTDSILKPTINFVDIQVSVSEPGSYSIKTDSINGYSFNAAGVFVTEGLNTVRLIGSGKPIVASSDVFTVKFDTSVCQFNVTVTGAGGGSTSAVFTLAGSPTTCTGATQSNNFYAGMATSILNYVDVKANVTTGGSYTINAGQVNGVSFSASGNLTPGTNQTIRLLATGTPTAAGSFPYALTTTAPASNCGFLLTVQAAATPAMYTFECPSNPTFFGTYQAGQSTAGDSVKINVTSTSGGSYSITTGTTTNSNGVTFVGNGVLPASLNPQSVTLYASGTATAAGSFTYTLSGTGVTSTCTFSQTYTAASTTNGTLSFNIGTVLKTFNFENGADTSFQSFPPPAPPGNFYVLTLGGNATSSFTNDIFDITIVKPAPYFSNGGTYTVNQFLQFIGVNVTYTDGTGVDYTASTDGTNQNPAFSITITSITANNVKGTFTGPVKNMAGSIITITNGAFDLPLQ